VAAVRYATPNSSLVRAIAALGVVAAALVTLAWAPRLANADPSKTSIEQGWELGEIQHPRVMAMGGAVHAYGGSTTAMLANPANLYAFRSYALEGLASFTPEAGRQSYGGAVADSTGPLAGGFAGTWSQMDPDGLKRRWTDLRLSLAYALGSTGITLGATGRYLRVSQNTAAGPLGASLASGGTPGDPMLSELTFDAGAAIALGDHFRVGLTGRNLTAPGTALAPLALAGGIGYSSGAVRPGDLTLEVNGLVDFTTRSEARGRVMVGGEILVHERVPVRAGYRYDDVMKTHAVSAGAGYVDPRFSLDVGARRDVVADQPATAFVVGLRFFITDSMGSGGAPDPM
jgi:hypothetical protein